MAREPQDPSKNDPFDPLTALIPSTVLSFLATLQTMPTVKSISDDCVVNSRVVMGDSPERKLIQFDSIFLITTLEYEIRYFVDWSLLKNPMLASDITSGYFRQRERGDSCSKLGRAFVVEWRCDRSTTIT